MPLMLISVLLLHLWPLIQQLLSAMHPPQQLLREDVLTSADVGAAAVDAAASAAAISPINSSRAVYSRIVRTRRCHADENDVIKSHLGRQLQLPALWRRRQEEKC